ncbi:MAG: thioesterase family protein [Polyangiales bacterium]
MAFRSSIRVRFGDEDHAQIVYYPRFFDFFHQAFEDFFDDCGWPYRKVLDEDHVGWPAVRVEADYKSPLRFGDVLEVELWVDRLGEKSATFAYRGTQRVGGALVVEAKVVSACIDMRTFKAQSIPTKYRELFAKHLAAP